MPARPDRKFLSLKSLRSFAVFATECLVSRWPTAPSGSSQFSAVLIPRPPTGSRASSRFCRLRRFTLTLQWRLPAIHFIAVWLCHSASSGRGFATDNTSLTARPRARSLPPPCAFATARLSATIAACVCYSLRSDSVSVCMGGFANWRP